MNREVDIVDPFFYHSKNPMIVLSKDFGLVSANKAFVKLVGFTIDDFNGNLNFTNLLHENDRDTFCFFINDRTDQQSEIIFEFRLINSKGIFLWVSCISSFIHDNKFHVSVIERDKMKQPEITEANHILNEIINRVPHPIFLKDHTGKYVLVNQSQSELFSMSSIDLLGKDDSNLISDPIEIQEIIETDLQVINNGRLIDLPEQTITTSRGEKKVLYTTKVPLISPVDGKTFILGVSIDLTTLKKYEEALKLSEEKYKSLVELSPDAIIILENGRIAFINNSGLALLKASSADDLIGKKFFNFIHEDCHSVVIKRHIQLRNGKKVEPIEEKYIQLDGKVIDVEVSSIPFYFKNNFAIQIIARDISDRVKARNNLFKRKQEFQALAENSNDIIARFNGRYEFLYVNKTISDYTKRAPDYFIDKSISDVGFPHSFLRNVKRIIDVVFKNGKIESVYFELPSLNGSENCFATIVPERNKNNEIKSVLCTVRNINELKIKEHELISINKELNTFIYKASHDLKGPLATILGLSNLSNSGYGKSQDEELFKLINKTALGLNDTLKRLLEIVRIKDDALAIESIEVLAKIQSVIREYENIEIKGGAVFSMGSNQTCVIKSDRAILNSVVRNLIENSIQYKRDGVLRVEIIVEKYKDGVQISIIDNGMGIEEEVQDKIFDMFFRGNINSKGPGLGLYLVKNALNRLKGTISFKTRLGEGSRFILYIPSFTYRKRV